MDKRIGTPIADADKTIESAIKSEALVSLDVYNQVVKERNIAIEQLHELGYEFGQKVLPQEPRCKDCKWWKDRDGKYRRGCDAESKCPINTHEVYCGEGYCYMFSPKEDM